jgi:hypothetical protein
MQQHGALLAALGQPPSARPPPRPFEAYGSLLAWMGTSAEQRRARIEADAPLRAHILHDLVALADDPDRAGNAPDWPQPLRAGSRGGGDGVGAAAGGIRRPAALSVTEVLGLWAPDGL